MFEGPREWGEGSVLEILSNFPHIGSIIIMITWYHYEIIDACFAASVADLKIEWKSERGEVKYREAPHLT